LKDVKNKERERETEKGTVPRWLARA